MEKDTSSSTVIGTFKSNSGKQLNTGIQNSGISTKNFEETRTIHAKSEPLKIFMVNFLIHFHKDFKVHKKNQMKEEANLFLIMLNYYIIIFKG